MIGESIVYRCLDLGFGVTLDDIGNETLANFCKLGICTKRIRLQVTLWRACNNTECCTCTCYVIL